MSEITKIADGKEWDTLMDLASKLEPSIRAAFVKAATAARQSLDVKELTTYLENGQIGAAEQALTQALSFKGLLPSLQAALVRAAGVELATASRTLGITMHLDAYNPVVVEFAQRYTGGLIVQLDQQQLAGARTIITDALQEGTAPATVARDLKSVIGLDAEKQSWVMSYRAALESGDLNALKRVLRDARSDKKVLRQFQSGESLSAEEVDRLVQRYSDRVLMYRAEMVARTESIDALNAGQQLAWAQAVRDGYKGDLYSRWFVAPDERVCPICKEIPKMNPDGVPFMSAFATPIGPLYRPTAHPKCRCVLFTRPR